MTRLLSKAQNKLLGRQGLCSLEPLVRPCEQLCFTSCHAAQSQPPPPPSEDVTVWYPDEGRGVLFMPWQCKGTPPSKFWSFGAFIMPKMSKLFYNHTLTLLYQHEYFIKSTKQSKCSVCVYECIPKTGDGHGRQRKSKLLTKLIYMFINFKNL